MFLEGAPIFAVEVRSAEDYGPAAEKRMAQKRADYFAAGTLVVWDVGVLQEKMVRVYRFHDPQNPSLYREGEIAEAEPALADWSLPVSDITSELYEMKILKSKTAIASALTTESTMLMRSFL